MSEIEQVPEKCECGYPLRYPIWRIGYLRPGQRYVCTQCAAKKYRVTEAITLMAANLGLQKCFTHFGSPQWIPPQSPGEAIICNRCPMAGACQSMTGDGEKLAATFKDCLTRIGPMDTHEIEMAYAAWCRYNRLEPGDWLHLAKWLESGHPKADYALQKLGLKKGGD